jgi:hypothetical protein
MQEKKHSEISSAVLRGGAERHQRNVIGPLANEVHAQSLNAHYGKPPSKQDTNALKLRLKEARKFNAMLRTRATAMENQTRAAQSPSRVQRRSHGR